MSNSILEQLAIMDQNKAKRILEETFRNHANFQWQILGDAQKSAIAKIILGGHKTYRYICFTALLAKVCAPSIHMRAIQSGSKLKGAYDARSLCHKVVVPFEKDVLAGRLGDSNEPYLNKPARCLSIEKDNPVKGRTDRELLFCLYDLLEELNNSTPEMQKEAFQYAFSLVMQRPVRDSNEISLPEIEQSSLEINGKINDFLARSYEGEAPVAVMWALLKIVYGNAATIEVHPANEAGASSKEVGDIDIKFSDGKLYAVEVKDKHFTDTDVNHATEKVKKKGFGRMIFAYGFNCGERYANAEERIAFWAREGVELSFVSIPVLLHQILSVMGKNEYVRLLHLILHGLYDMKAKDATVQGFQALFAS